MAMHETGHSTNTIVDWYNFHRDVCAQYFIDHPLQIGGAGKVEIDESKFGQRKYNRERYQEGHWVFGGIERGSVKAFMVEVDDSNMSTNNSAVHSPRDNSFIRRIEMCTFSRNVRSNSKSFYTLCGSFNRSTYPRNRKYMGCNKEDDEEEGCNGYKQLTLPDILTRNFVEEKI